MTTITNPINGQLVDASHDEVRYGQMTITPQQARAILAERNVNNRSISDSVANRYARDMKSGAWLLNGDPIRFSTDGALLDGQHRLAAIVKAGTEVRVFVVWNLPAEAQATMDDGRKRTMANVLELNGQSDHSKTVASILRRAIAWNNDRVAVGGYDTASKSEMQSFYTQHPEVLDSAAVADAIRNAKVIRCAASTLGLAHYLFAKINRQDADEFFRQLRTGAIADEKSPVLVLRNRLSAEGSTRLRTESGETLAWFIKAWNAYRAGKTITILRLRAGEGYPEPK